MSGIFYAEVHCGKYLNRAAASEKKWYTIVSHNNKSASRLLSTGSYIPTSIEQSQCAPPRPFSLLQQCSSALLLHFATAMLIVLLVSTANNRVNSPTSRCASKNTCFHPGWIQDWEYMLLRVLYGRGMFSQVTIRSGIYHPSISRPRFDGIYYNSS